VLLFYVVGDVGTTAINLELGYREANPVVRSLIDGGYVPWVFAKIGFTTVTFCLWIVWPKPYAHIFPFIITVGGVALVANNASLVL